MSFLDAILGTIRGKTVSLYEALTVVGLSILLMFALLFSFTSTSTAKKPVNPIAPIQMVVTKGNLTSTVSQSGLVVSLGDTNVVAKVAERVVSLLVKFGDRVSIGTPLAVLDNNAEVTALSQAKINLNTQVITLNNAAATLQAAQDTAAQNLLGYQQNTQAALNNLNAAKEAVAIKNQNYQNAVDQAQINFSNNQNLYLGLSNYMTITNAVALPVLTTCQAYNSPSTQCTQLLQYYASFQSAQIALQTAQQNQQLNQKSDNLQITNLSSTYNTALLSGQAGQQRDNQLVEAAKRNYATLATQFGVSVPNPTPSNFVLAQHQISVAQANLDATVVKAPVSGVIIQVGAQQGEIAPAGGYLSNGKINNLVAIRSSDMQLQCNFNLVDGKRVTLGEIATVTFPGLTNPLRTAKVSDIILAPATLNVPPAIQVTLTLTSTSSDLYPGLKGTASISIPGAHDTVIVPNAAIQNENGQKYVLKVLHQNGGTQLAHAPVILGEVGNTTTEIKSGLIEGDTIQFTPAPPPTNQ